MPRQEFTPKKDAYQEITDLMINELESGKAPWRRPWGVSGMKPKTNLFTGRVYGITNQFILRTRPYVSSYWVGFDQARQAGGHVRKGEKSTPIIKWTVIKKNETVSTPDGEQEREFVFMRPMVLRVFNAEQCDGLTIPDDPSVPTIAFEPHHEADRIIRDMPNPPRLGHGGDRAFYRPSTDSVQMPNRESFSGVPEYYSTLFHEFTHSTGHESRVARRSLTETVYFGSEPYAKEELVAEMGAAYLCGKAGFIDMTYQNSGAYLRSWIDILKKDKRVFIQASQLAQHAVEYILNVKKDN